MNVKKKNQLSSVYNLSNQTKAQAACLANAQKQQFSFAYINAFIIGLHGICMKLSCFIFRVSLVFVFLTFDDHLTELID